MPAASPGTPRPGKTRSLAASPTAPMSMATSISTLHYFMTLAMQHGGMWAGTGLNYNNTKASQRSDVNYLASSAGPMAQTPGDASGRRNERGRPGDRAPVWCTYCPCWREISSGNMPLALEKYSVAAIKIGSTLATYFFAAKSHGAWRQSVLLRVPPPAARAPP
jgi:hypothetical protein